MEIVNAPVRVEIIARTRIDWARLRAVLKERGLSWVHYEPGDEEPIPAPIGQLDVDGTEGALLAEYAGRGCYNSFGGPNGAGMGRTSNADYIRHLIESGHHSVFEHVSFTFAIWQCSRGLCYDDQTEVLTRRGWRLLTALAADDEYLTYALDDRRVEWQRATSETHEPWDGDLIYAASSMVDLAVTPNHRMVYFPYDKRKDKVWKIAQAHEIEGKRVKMLRGVLPNTVWPEREPRELGRVLELLGDVPPTPENIKAAAWVLGLWITDGSISMPTREHGGRLCIGQTKPHVREGFIARCKAMGVRYSENDAGFRIHGNDLVRYVNEQFVYGTPRKEHQRIPSFMWDWPTDVIGAFVEGIIAGDGNVHAKNNHVVVYAGTPEFAGDLQALFMRIGYCATVREDDRRGTTRVLNGVPITNRKIGYIVSVTQRTNEHLFNRKHWSRRPYKGTVHCVTVPNGTLYVRRNGKACWSGNTHELVRHRVGVAISQASTRFRDESKGRFIVPTLLRKVYEEEPTIVQPLLDAAEQAARSYDDLLGILRDRRLIKAMGLEGTAARKAARGIARACLPIGLESPMTWTANVRMLWTVMDQRGSPHAEAEIREMAVHVHRLLIKEEPVLFGHLEEYQLQDGTYAIRKRQDSVDGSDRAPDRFSASGREAIDQIRDELGDVGFIAFCRGNEMKYRARAGLKGDAATDAAKAAWYGVMADHVATGSPDPRHLRPGFVPYAKP